MIANNAITATANTQLEEVYNTMILPLQQASEEMNAVEAEVTAAINNLVKDTIAAGNLDELVADLTGCALRDGFCNGFRYAVALLGGAFGGRKDG